MRLKRAWGFSAAAVVGLGIVLDGQWIPLGVPAEWDWERIPRELLPGWDQFWLALVVGIALVAWVAAGVRWIEAPGRWRFLGGLLVTTALAGAFQVALEIPGRDGLGKWIKAIYAPEVSGFFQVAKHASANVTEILSGYPDLVRRLPPGHISANPPGWVIVDRMFLDYFQTAERRRAFRALEPSELNAMFGRLTPPQGTAPEEFPAALAVSLLSRLAALLVILPAAWLAFMRHGRWGAWLAAGAAGMIPAATMFAPRCDCVYATVATLAIALAYHAAARAAKTSAFFCGLLIGVGMLFSLCFLVVAAFAAGAAGAVWLQRREVQRDVAICFAVGGLSVPLLILGATGSNMSHIWLANLAKNAEFNALTARTYWIWAAINPLEFLVALGLPAGILVAWRQASEIGKFRAAAPECVTIAWLVIMLLLNFSGNNRAEVARLWIFMMPSAAAIAFEWLPKDWRVAAAFLVLQTAACILLCRELTVM